MGLQVMGAWGNEVGSVIGPVPDQRLCVPLAVSSAKTNARHTCSTRAQKRLDTRDTREWLRFRREYATYATGYRLEAHASEGTASTPMPARHYIGERGGVRVIQAAQQ